MNKSHNLRNQRAPGMQIHAVPEAERAFDSSGRRLPWAYDYSAAAGSTEQVERAPTEKGPFGRSMRRSRSGGSRSRSKTAEPRREEDRIRAENAAAEDAVFGTLRRTGTKDDGAKGARDGLGDVDPNTAALQPISTAPGSDNDGEPTEVLLYGFGHDLQWAAIDFYERVSNGVILEDYHRQPPGQRYDIARTLGRQAAQSSISRAAMRKKNRYAGGEHWIKVTFNSRQAAELALTRQPHIIKGYQVFAEQYHGRGPQKDEPVLATQAGAQLTSETLPLTFSTHQALDDSPNGSSTISSATATGSTRALQRQGSPFTYTPKPNDGSPSRSKSQAPFSLQTTGFQLTQNAQAQAPNTHVLPRRGPIEGATRAVILPAELALAPKQPRASWTAWVGAGEVIGSALPRKEDGTFDWDRSSLYWKFFWWIDRIIGSDFCGLKDE